VKVGVIVNIYLIRWSAQKRGAAIGDKTGLKAEGTVMAAIEHLGCF
jgi:hypothetical protein